MLKVGVSEAADASLHRLMPPGVTLEVIPVEPERAVDVEFWIVPPYPRHAAQAWPWLRGVHVAQSSLAGVDGLLPLFPPEVTLCDARGVHSAATAEWVLAVILASLKDLPLYDDIRRAGVWQRRKEAQERYCALHPGEQAHYPRVLLDDLQGKRALIVGYGSIGQAIEERLQPFGVEIDRVARTARAGVSAIGDLADLLPAADIVVLIVPMTAETAGMIGAKELALMKPGALLVNAARGPVVNTAALLAALGDGHLRAALDVSDPEPLPDGHPLWSAPNLILTPHIAASTPMFMTRVMRFAAKQVSRYVRGEPLENVVKGAY
ncbi:MAG TPA: 2-hydroxyacid dehydrogenase [Acidobacteriaceae bacterium]|jgi:phosphoglycerate dehydrogenase-like enzyme|nr:2-hydroxyacid dehydrogenase [Acidobacteriaceae bacterium]